MPTKRDFHGWHGDEWYDQEVSNDIPKEVKLGFYLTDVRSGAFNYIRGTHRKQHPRRIRTADLPAVPASQIAELTGPAGTAFLFDTSGIHRQGVPMLEPRHVVFLNYHDPIVRLQKGDIESYRYHPLLLNAAFLGNLKVLTATRERFGGCLLIDCHSMPSVGGPMERDAGRSRVDFVLGDCHSVSCDRMVISRAERTLRDLGFAVARNTPYSGGFVTQHYGRPADGLHALQIEINRALYMDEATIARSSGFAALAERLKGLVRTLGDIATEVVRA